MFKSDQPIKSIKEDILGRGSFAVSLATAIVGYEHQNSLALALYGDWGSVKSSVINMTLEHIGVNRCQSHNRE